MMYGVGDSVIVIRSGRQGTVVAIDENGYLLVSVAGSKKNCLLTENDVIPLGEGT